MTTAQEVESTIDECNTAPVVNKYLRQYAEMIQKYADAVAENVRLRSAMDKYLEDEMLLIERCAKVCERQGKERGECPEMPEYCADAIRALAKPVTESVTEKPAQRLAIAVAAYFYCSFLWICVVVVGVVVFKIVGVTCS